MRLYNRTALRNGLAGCLLSWKSVVLGVALGFALSAQAHEIRPGLLQVSQTADSSYSVVWKQPLLGDRRLPLEPLLQPDCRKVDAQMEATTSALIERWTTSCTLQNIEIGGLNRTLTDVMLEYTDLRGEQQRALLRPESPSYELGSGGAGSAWLYLKLGVEHLLAGYDHVLFVLGLLLLIRSTRSLLITITCFTLAHSITLGLSVLGWVTLSQAAVEACIALSIVLLAREALTNGDSLLKQKPWLAAFAFGLLHGFGFAGALRDIGLPDDNLWVALLSFNVGIEIGQLLLVGAWVTLGWLATRLLPEKTRQSATPRLQTLAAYAIGGMAIYWTLQRVLPMFDNTLTLT